MQRSRKRIMKQVTGRHIHTYMALPVTTIKKKTLLKNSSASYIYIIGGIILVVPSSIFN